MLEILFDNEDVILKKKSIEFRDVFKTFCQVLPRFLPNVKMADSGSPRCYIKKNVSTFKLKGNS